MGILAQQAASYKKGVWCFCCSAYNSSKCSAIIFLLALTTALPFCNAFFTIIKAASASSINSTITLMFSSSSKTSASVVKISSPMVLFFSLFLMHIFLMEACKVGVLCNTSYKPFPTTPKPNKPMQSLFVDILYFFNYAN